MARVTLLDGNHGEWSRLAAVDKSPDTFDIGNTGFFELIPQGGGAERRGKITVGRFHRRRAENDRIIAVIDALDRHQRNLAYRGISKITGPFAERTFLRQ